MRQETKTTVKVINYGAIYLCVQSLRLAIWIFPIVFSIAVNDPYYLITFVASYFIDVILRQIAQELEDEIDLLLMDDRWRQLGIEIAKDLPPMPPDLIAKIEASKKVSK